MDDIRRNKEVVAEDFARRRRNQLLVAVPMVLALVALVFSDDGANTPIMGVPGAIALPILLGVLLAGFGFSFYNWRCPACKKYLGRGWNPRHCSGCGVQLHD